jgi:hypothetical protein
MEPSRAKGDAARHVAAAPAVPAATDEAAERKRNKLKKCIDKARRTAKAARRKAATAVTSASQRTARALSGNCSVGRRRRRWNRHRRRWSRRP